MDTRKPIDPNKELLLVFAFCMFRKQYREQLVKETAYGGSLWQQVGISQQALDGARSVVVENESYFAALNVAIHAAMRSGCPDPPCPNEAWLAMLVGAWSNE